MIPKECARPAKEGKQPAFTVGGIWRFRKDQFEQWFIVAVGVVSMLFANSADAKGRTGSRRVYSGHGKGSHYVGGKK